MKHLTPETIEALVMGLASTDSDEIRRHLAQCESCSGRLQHEAQLEMLLHAAAGSASATSNRPARFSWVTLQAAAALVVLAGGAFWLTQARNASVQTSRLHQPDVMGDEPRTAALGRDVESPRDYGKWAKPYQPCLEGSSTQRPYASDSL